MAWLCASTGLILGLLFLGVASQDASLNCPRFSLVNVSNNDMDTLVFGAFSPDTEPPDNDYNPGAIGPWYDIGSGIINVVQPGSLTEDVVLPYLRSSNVNFSNFDSFGNLVNNEEGQLQDFGSDLARWWAGIIALTLLGGLIAVGMLVCCCCFGLCRCCGKCGGNLKQEETSSTNCLTIVFTIILVAFVCWLSAAIVLAFFSNQQVFDSVTEFESTVDETFDLAEIFINDSVSKIETLLCQVDDTFDVTVGQADALISQANGVVDSFSDDIYDIVDQTIGVSQDIENIESTLMSINGSVNDLQSNTSSINGSLQSIGDSLEDAFSNCTQLMMIDSSIDCSPLNPETYRNGLGANFFEVPNIGSELANVQNILRDVNLTDSALEGNRTFNSAVQQISNLTRDVDNVIDDGLGELRTVTTSANNIIGNFTNDAVGPGGFIDSARDRAREAFQFVRQYDTPRYAIGVVISISAVAVVVLVLLGVCCGMCGFRTDRAPYERTDISNCGGVTLICATFVAFIIGFFVMILSALVFFTGGVSTKFCEDLAPPDYVIFARTVDNTELTGNYLLSDNLFDDGSIQLTISGILTNCSGNATVYQALKLENLGFIRDIQNFTNISQLIPEVSLNVSSLTDSIADVFDSDTFVPQDLQDRLDDFTAAGVNTINISQFRQQLDQNILSFNASMEIMRLESLRAELNNLTFTPPMPNAMAQRDAIIVSINTTIDELMSIDSRVSSLSSSVNSLDASVRNLDDNGRTLTDSASALLSSINTTFENLVNNGVTPLVDNASTVFPRAIGYAQQLVDFGLNALQNEVGNCRPISAIYIGFYNSYCSFTVDGLNGFWLALGMCGILMIPIIIFSVIASHYYRRMKYDDDVGIPYESSFPMKTY